MGLVERLLAAQLPNRAERRAIRKRAGASQQDIADELGVTLTSVRYWESGRSEPRRETAIAYRRLLDRLRALSEQQ